LKDPGLRQFASNFDKVIFNTVVCWPAVEQLEGLGGLVWYVHESEAVYRFARDFPEFVASLHKDVSILVPSPLVERALLEQGISSRVLPYGSEDLAARNSFETHGGGKIVIGVFGSYELRKGQDLAVRGMLSIAEDLRCRAEMRLFGRTLEPRFRQDVEASAGGDASISFFGEVDHDECIRQMAATDIILIPSRDDPLPFVSLDALALGKPIVCSATTGTSAYLREDKSGLILYQNTPEEIGSALRRLIIDPRLRQTLAIGGRQLYRQMFTQEAFEASLFQRLGLC
jgi:glycosyltransferase involved in cell wall biosynthesis